jgi:hypothetical protein
METGRVHFTDCRFAMRILSLIFISSCTGFAQQPELQYRLSAPKNWQVWILSGSSIEAISNYNFANDRDGRRIIEEKIKTGKYITYTPGDRAIFVDEDDNGDAWRVKVVDGESRGREGWIHYRLGEMTEESRAQLARLEERKRIAEVKKRTAAKKAAEEAQRKELAYVNSLPQLTGPSETVIVATSIDCARDLQNVVGLGKKNGTGVEFRKKMVELMTLGCAASIPKDTPLVYAIKNGQFVTFKAYKSGKEGVGALRERPLALKN